MRKLNVGIIGYGFMGRAHSNAYRQVNKFFDLEVEPELKVGCASPKAKQQGFAARWGGGTDQTDWREP